MLSTRAFIKELPSVLDEVQLQEYFQKYKDGDLEARNILIKHNLKLVVFIAHKYLNTCDGVKIELDDLIMSGAIGLIKGIDTYKNDKNIKLNSYLSKCIHNQILMYLRKFRKFKSDISFEGNVSTNEDGDELTIEDKYYDEKSNFVDEDIIKRVELLRIRELVEELEGIDKEVIKMSFGFYNDRIYSQKEIAEVTGISQSYISRKVRKLTKSLKSRLIEEGIY